MLFLYSAAVVLGAWLLFLVQPMAARMLLPVLGGSPSVWIASMLFFQAALLAGYAYAHGLGARLRARSQVAVHLVALVLPLALLPPALGGAEQATAPLGPVWRVLVLLATAVGAPFLALATTGPLMQRWFSRSRHVEAGDPYFLYAASNAGSLAALFGYPLLIEPRLALRAQALLFAAGYVVWLGLVAGCGLVLWRRDAAGAHSAAAVPSAAPSAGRRLRWLALAFAPSSVLLGATQHLTTDLAPVPLLWLVPLGIYLGTFVAAFARRWRPSPVRWGLALGVLAPLLAVALRSNVPLSLSLLVPFHLGVVLVVGMTCHARLAADRPPADRLTEFYLILAAGGVLGGLFNALVAPAIFDSIAEYPVAVILACALRPGRWPRWIDVAIPGGFALLVVAAEALGVPSSGWMRLGAATAFVLALVPWPWRHALALAVLFLPLWLGSPSGIRLVRAERTFFGVHRVLEIQEPPIPVRDADGSTRFFPRKPYLLLQHGTTGHGSQYPDPELAATPTAYYHRSGPIGQVFAAFESTARLDRVAVVGLGSGAIAAYARPGRSIEFFEIDAEVERIARENFRYLADARGPVAVRIGDGRALVGELADGSQGLVVIDAFSSDAVPVHLATREAVELYLRKLAAQGLLAVHVTSDYVDLVRVFAAIARELGLVGLYQDDRNIDDVERLELKAASTWVLLGREAASLGRLTEDSRWRPIETRPGRQVLWTDEFTNLVGVLKLRRGA